MTQRRKQPARGSRKPPRRKPMARPPELKPFKIIGQLIGARYDEHGEIVGEEVMGEVAIYRSNFGKVQQLVDRAVKEARKAEENA